MKVTEQRDCVFVNFFTQYFISFMVFTIAKRLLGNEVWGTVVAAIVAFIWFVKPALNAFMVLMHTYAAQIFLMWFAVLFMYLLSALRGVPTYFVWNHYVSSSFCIIIGWAMYSVKNLQLLYDEMFRICKWLAILSVGIVFVNRDVALYSMRYSYLLSIILYFYTNAVIEGKKKYIIIIILELVLLLIYGSRGPILCYMIFLGVSVFLKKGSGWIKSIVVTLGVLGIVFYNNIGAIILKTLNTYGIRSRTLSLLFSDFSHTSGRDILADQARVMIQKKPVFGWGIAGEYLEMENYPHNIFLELQIDYGVVIGCGIFWALLIITVILVFRLKGVRGKLFLIFVAYGYISLFYSGTYLTDHGFSMFLGLMLNCMRQCKKKSEYIIKNKGVYFD